ncbi:isoprenyl transferase [bacterium]|nr:isoprenyl transferase [bacterium]
MSDASSLKEEVLRQGNLPRHVAIIMDGNGRWAKKRALPRIMGHREGRKAVRRITESARELGIGYLTLYTFSTENWMRPLSEVTALMGFLEEVLKDEIQNLNENGIRLQAMGRLDQLPDHTRKALDAGIERLSKNSDMTLTLALSYGGRAEITDAAKSLAKAAVAGTLDAESIDEDLFARHLYLPDNPPVDLLIRTSGESRISNFCLWQLAYSEIHITDTLWPDFDAEHLYRAVSDYQGRERRYGK